MPVEDYIAKVWGVVKSWAVSNAHSYVCAAIPNERTDLTGPFEPIRPNRDYMRLWLSQMFLARDVAWFKEWYPAVHTSVQLKSANRNVTVSHVTGPAENLSRGVKLDYAVTDLLPFYGGKIEIESGLLGLKGKDYIAASIGILQDFSGLVTAPLSQALDIAQKVSGGFDKLVGANGGEVRLAFHREYVSSGGGASDLKPGYIAVVGATADEIDQNRLSVRDSQLQYDGRPLEGSNFMLFRIEGRSERDDWRFPNIEEPLNQAIAARLKGNEDDAKAYKTAALLAVWQSPDFAPQDRRRVANAIEAEMNELGGGMGAVRGHQRNLAEIMQAHHMDLRDALRQPPLTFQEIVGSPAA
jgi:hypothetical protein